MEDTLKIAFYLFGVSVCASCIVVNGDWAAVEYNTHQREMTCFDMCAPSAHTNTETKLKMQIKMIKLSVLGSIKFRASNADSFWDFG